MFTTADLPANMRLDPEDVFSRATPTADAAERHLRDLDNLPEPVK